MSFYSLRLLYNSKFILMATSLGTNDVVETRIHYICLRSVCRLQRYSSSKGRTATDGGIRRTTTDDGGWYPISSLGAFGSGELKRKQKILMGNVFKQQ